MDYMKELGLPVEPEPSTPDITAALAKARRDATSLANGGTRSQEWKVQRLKDMDEIQRVLDGGQMPAAIEAERTRLIGQIEKEMKELVGLGSTSFGPEDLKMWHVYYGKRVLESTIKDCCTRAGMGPVTQKNSQSAVVPTPEHLPEAKERQIGRELAKVDATGINDLFDFLEHYSRSSFNRGGRTFTRADLMNMDRKSLFVMIQKWQQELAVSGAHTTKATVFGTLLANCKFVTETDEYYRKYRNTILYQTCAVFNLIRRVPVNSLTSSQFAEDRIREIAAHFSVGLDVALAIYNEALAKLNPPQKYEPRGPVGPKVRCLCDRWYPATDRTCSFCGRELYIKCPQCGEAVAASSEYCSKGHRIKALVHIPTWIAKIDVLLRKSDIDSILEAEQWMLEIETLNPKEAKLPELRSRITAAKNSLLAGKIAAMVKQARGEIARKEYGKASNTVDEIGKLDPGAAELPALRMALGKFAEDQKKVYDELDKLCNARKYYAARKYMQDNSELSAGYGRANEIRQAIDDVDKLKRKNGLNPSEETALQILSLCTDAPGVVMPAPKPATGVNATVEAATSKVAIRWTPSASKPQDSVTYHVYRQVGGGKPVTVGTNLVAEDVTGNHCTDGNPPIAKDVWYYVVARRGGREAALCAAGTPVRVLPELDEGDLSVQSVGKDVHFVWKLPAGAKGVRLLRNGMDQRVPAGATKTSLQATPGKVEGFTLQVWYEINGVNTFTPGISRSVEVTSLEPFPFNLEDVGSKTNAVWNTQKENANIRFILTNTAFTSGQTVTEQEIQEAALDKRTYDAQVVACKCDLGVLPAGAYNVAAFIQMVGAWQACPTVRCQNIPVIPLVGIRHEMGLGNSVELSGFRLPAKATGMKVIVNERPDVDPAGPLGTEYKGQVNHVVLGGLKQGEKNTIRLYAMYGNGASVQYSQPTVYNIELRDLPDITCTMTWEYKTTGVFRKVRELTGLVLTIRMPAGEDFCPALCIVGPDRSGMRATCIGDGARLMTLGAIDDEKDYGRLFPRNERTIRFDACQNGAGVELKGLRGNGRVTPAEEKVTLIQQDLKGNIPLCIFEDTRSGARSFDIQLNGDWSVPR